MNYRSLIIRSSPNYVSSKKYTPSKPKTQPLFPFDKMKLGDYIQVPLNNHLDKNEINTLRTNAHQCARLCGIWIKTSVQREVSRFVTDDRKFVLNILHDGERE